MKANNILNKLKRRNPLKRSPTITKTASVLPAAKRARATEVTKAYLTVIKVTLSQTARGATTLPLKIRIKRAKRWCHMLVSR